MDVLFVLLFLAASFAFGASIVLLLVRVLFKKGLSLKVVGIAAGASFALIIGSAIGVGVTADEVETASAVESEQAEAEEEKIAEEMAEKERLAEEAKKEEERLVAEKEAEEKAAAAKLAKEKEQAEQERLAKEKAAEEAAAKEQAEGFGEHKLIEVDGGDLSGHREANVVVNIGFGDREYWAFTNEHGQLERVVAAEIVLQDDDSEPVLSNGRYYSDEAKVPGTESDILDEGHVIADSLGGVANAYNITPQESTLNRHGDQAYMEKVIRDAGGATDFEAIITYPNAETQVPSSYQFTYTVAGNQVIDTFDNVNPDEVNASLGLTKSEPAEEAAPAPASGGSAAPSAGGDVSAVDANGNGKVTIQEAKDAGFSMPIYSDHWLYQYMDDRDGDGMVGE